MTVSPTWIGNDVAKHWLDIDDLAESFRTRLDNTALALAAFAARVTGRQAVVVFETAGSYDFALRHGLQMLASAMRG